MGLRYTPEHSAKDLEELLYEASAYFIRKEVIELSRELKKKEPKLSTYEACEQAFKKLLNDKSN